MKNKNLWEKGVDLIVDSLGYFIVRVAPVIAPIPSIVVILEVSKGSYFAWFTVITIEMVGYAIGDKMVEAVRRNVFSLRKAAIPLVIYALIIEGLMLGYKVLPVWTNGSSWADVSKDSVALLYPCFTLAGAGLYAFHEYMKEIANDSEYEKENNREVENSVATKEREISHQKKLLELADYKRKLEDESELEKQKGLLELRIKEDKAKVKLDSKVDSLNQNSESKKTKNESDESKIIHFYSSKPLAKQREASDSIGFSQSKVNRILNQLESDKRIHRNGNGVEIL